MPGSRAAPLPPLLALALLTGCGIDVVLGEMRPDASDSESGADGSRAHDLYRTACKAGFAVACDRYALAR